MSPISPLPGPGPGPRPVGESLDRLTASLGAPRAAVLAELFDSWPSLVGEAVAAHARPQSLHHGILVVVVDDPVWVTQLRWLEADLLARLADAVGAGVVTEVRIRTSPP